MRAGMDISEMQNALSARGGDYVAALEIDLLRAKDKDFERLLNEKTAEYEGDELVGKNPEFESVRNLNISDTEDEIITVSDYRWFSPNIYINDARSEIGIKLTLSSRVIPTNLTLQSERVVPNTRQLVSDPVIFKGFKKLDEKISSYFKIIMNREKTVDVYVRDKTSRDYFQILALKKNLEIIYGSVRNIFVNGGRHGN